VAAALGPPRTPGPPGPQRGAPDAPARERPSPEKVRAATTVLASCG
jgi:hypothetical protein